MGTVSSGQPTTRVVHPDYAPLSFANIEPIGWMNDPRLVRIHYYPDRQIKLSRPAATVEARVLALAGFASTMWFAYFGKHCEWTHARGTLEILEQMRASLAESSDSSRLDEVKAFDTVRAQGDCQRKK